MVVNERRVSLSLFVSLIDWWCVHGGRGEGGWSGPVKCLELVREEEKGDADRLAWLRDLRVCHAILNVDAWPPHPRAGTHARTNTGDLFEVMKKKMMSQIMK